MCDKIAKIPVTMRITGNFPMLLSGIITAIEQGSKSHKYGILENPCVLCVGYKLKRSRSYVDIILQNRTVIKLGNFKSHFFQSDVCIHSLGDG